jgi:peptidoglycan/xylan/chitin deacetylase (PgdA/CDA1 family)
MHSGGLFSFGGHTHRHLILGRCAESTIREEIRLSRDALMEATGVQPTLFAYPNGQDGDYSSLAAQLLNEAGFEAAMTMSPGFINRAGDLYALPRYGAPESVDEAEATVSGTYETLKEWRTSISPNRAVVK